MHEVFGDLWALPGMWRGVTTNSIVTANGLVMGGGVALEARDKYPGLAQYWGACVAATGNHCYFDNLRNVFSFPTKDHYRDPSILSLIEQSARELAAFAGHHPDEIFLLPRPGVGLGGLSWENDVKPALIPILTGDNIRVVTWRSNGPAVA